MLILTVRGECCASSGSVKTWVVGERSAVQAPSVSDSKWMVRLFSAPSSISMASGGQEEEPQVVTVMDLGLFFHWTRGESSCCSSSTPSGNPLKRSSLIGVELHAASSNAHGKIRKAARSRPSDFGRGVLAIEPSVSNDLP